ncbi:cupin domain-containing protein [Sinomicrobium pectinilyticum]|uniref:Cupin domain-containing protein n=1 Tax=Sinomicrobium pectinilyticum TaxID=1084421 RepID=A0A3N0EUD4_SINP1|nr:cupin domain-containing protein [Sinomicrobium pectinilyticum]RNL91319.1 cupin domain-containing protein [Sinomicrobium pectinilyticum]
MSIQKVNLEDKFSRFRDYWNPRIVGELNDQLVKVARFKDEFVMHQHENEDEMFLVIESKLLMELDDETLEINPGEFIIIPRKTNHWPKAIGEVKVVLFEPKTTVNTGNTENGFTVRDLKNI